PGPLSAARLPWGGSAPGRPVALRTPGFPRVALSSVTGLSAQKGGCLRARHPWWPLWPLPASRRGGDVAPTGGVVARTATVVGGDVTVVVGDVRTRWGPSEPELVSQSSRPIRRTAAAMTSGTSGTSGGCHRRRVWGWRGKGGPAATSVAAARAAVSSVGAARGTPGSTLVAAGGVVGPTRT